MYVLFHPFIQDFDLVLLARRKNLDLGTTPRAREPHAQKLYGCITFMYVLLFAQLFFSLTDAAHQRVKTRSLTVRPFLLSLSSPADMHLRSSPALFRSLAAAVFSKIDEALVMERPVPRQESSVGFWLRTLSYRTRTSFCICHSLTCGIISVRAGRASRAGGDIRSVRGIKEAGRSGSWWLEAPQRQGGLESREQGYAYDDGK
jgi:hypothetical protein